MAIPDYQSIMLPLLQFASDKLEHSVRESIEFLAEQYKLTESERNEFLPSGQQATFDNRVGWAATYMKKAKLLEPTRKAHFQITERGLATLQERPDHINVRYLHRYPEFIEFKKKRNQTDKSATSLVAFEAEEQTPEEAIESLRGSFPAACCASGSARHS